jgi:nucleotide-binding universal stress UspA family protein
MLHVISPIPGYMTAELPELFAEKSEENAKAMLDQFAREHGSAIRAQTMVRTGVAQHEIVAAAQEIGADLIIIASHKPEAADYLLGSTAAAVVRHAPCSVLVHR